jgi:hypothetical protein
MSDYKIKLPNIISSDPYDFDTNYKLNQKVKKQNSNITIIEDFQPLSMQDQMSRL